MVREELSSLLADAEERVGSVVAPALVREYDGLDPETVETGADPDDPYSGMQTPVFEMLDDAGRLCRWTTETDLVGCAEPLP